MGSLMEVSFLVKPSNDTKSCIGYREYLYLDRNISNVRQKVFCPETEHFLSKTPKEPYTHHPKAYFQINFTEDFLNIICIFVE